MESIRYLGSPGIVLVVAQLALFVSGQDCLLAAGGRATPFKDDNYSIHLPSGTQAIITSYKFGCCGNITAWKTYVQPGGGSHQGAYDIIFQVWRPSPAVQENGCYSMVGENRFTRLSLGSGLVSETPEPSNILTVQPGDVLGYFTLSTKYLGDGIQLDTNQSIDSVWYHTNTESEHLIEGASNCPRSVGTGTGRSLKSFTNAAPVLSVSVASFPCTSAPTISSSSSLPPSSVTNSAAPANSATTISTVNAITPVNTDSEGIASISTALIAIVGGLALLFTLLCMLVLTITIAKRIEHAQGTKNLVETSSIVADQQVNTFLTTYHTTDDCYASTESNLAYGTVTILSMELQGNEAYMTTWHTTDE